MSAQPSTCIVELPGCTPEPLMSYLKALGVFRLVSQQADPQCRAAWRDGRLILTTSLDRDNLIAFFIQRYQPTPVVVPWTGSDFFDVKATKTGAKFAKTPTGAGIIEAFLQNDSPRIALYREAIKSVISTLKSEGIAKKEQMKEKTKAKYISRLRALPIPQIDEWIDSAAALPAGELKLNTLLGSGGGSDGNTHFSDNFMQNLWDVLPDFDAQKSSKNPGFLTLSASRSQNLLANALFEESVEGLEAGRTSSLYNAGAVGGANAGQGFERKAYANPWAFILTIEGCIAFASSVSRKLAATAQNATFPFQTRASATFADSLADKESVGREIWLPIWSRMCSYKELKLLLSEGRADWQGSPAHRGVDFAKAVASLGVDRGIDTFARYGIVKGRVGGDNYHTAAFLGRFDVRSRENVHLLREADAWIERFRNACTDKAPARFPAALRRLDSAVFDYCRFGGTDRFQAILIALGHTERLLAGSPKFRADAWLHPLRGLSSDWVSAADDHSPEFEIAVALAGIRGDSGDPGIRTNLEPIARSNKGGLDWNDDSTDAVWSRGDLAANLAAVLERRVLAWKKDSLPAPPLASCRSVRPATLSAFLHDELDDEKIESLLWGLLGCRIEPRPATAEPRPPVDAPPLPRIYPLLKTAFTGLHHQSLRPKNLEPREAALWEKLILVRPDARLLQLLRAGNLPEASTLAARRARHADLIPADIDWQSDPPPAGLDPTRLAAALLLPISPQTLLHLWALLARRKKPEVPFA